MSTSKKKAAKTDKKKKPVVKKQAKAPRVVSSRSKPKPKPVIKKTKPVKTRPKPKPDLRSLFLASLEEKRQEIKETLDRLITSRKEYSGQLTSGEFIDEVDDAQREISAYSQYSLMERKIRELQKIDQLIVRVTKDEEFGRCEECGNPIPKERLFIVPEATLCVPCQRELEKLDQKKSLASRGSPTFGPRKDMEWDSTSGSEDDENILIEYHIGSLPEVDIEEAEVESPPEEKEEK